MGEVKDMGRCTLAEVEARIRHLVDTQYQGLTREILERASESGEMVSFSVYPLEWTKAAEFQYELYLPRVVADSVDGFVVAVARAVYERYATEGGIDLDADDIYCVDITS